MKILKYLLWFLFGVILFYIFNTIYYKLYEQFTIGAPIFKLLQDNTGYYSFIDEGGEIPDDKNQIGQDYNISVGNYGKYTRWTRSSATYYNSRVDPRTINNPNNPFYDSSILVLGGGCPTLPTTDPSQLPDGYKVIMIPITKTKDFEILFGLYDPLLAVDYSAYYYQNPYNLEACSASSYGFIRSHNQILEQLYQNCLNTNYISMSNSTFNETQVIHGFLRVYDLCRTYEILERGEHETDTYMRLKNLQSALDAMSAFVDDYQPKKRYVEENEVDRTSIIDGLDPLYDRTTRGGYGQYDYITYDKYSNTTYHLRIINDAIDNSNTIEQAWESYQTNLSNSQRTIIEDLNEERYEDVGWSQIVDGVIVENREEIDEDLDYKLNQMKITRVNFDILYQYRKYNRYITRYKQKYVVYNIYLNKYYRDTKIANFSGSSDTQSLPDGNNFSVYLSAIVKNDLPEVRTCEEIIRLGFDNFRVSVQAFVMSLVGTSQSSIDLIQMGYCTSDLYRTGFKRLDGLQEQRMPQTALKLHLNVVQNLQSSGTVLKNLLVSPLPSMMKVLRDHLCIAYNIPMGIVSLGFQDDKNNPHFTFMDKHLMELNVEKRSALYNIAQILFSNPEYLNRNRNRFYFDYPLDKLKPKNFDLEELIFLFEFLKNDINACITLAGVNEIFSRQIKILFNIQADSPNTSLLELPKELTKPEKDLLKKHKTTDIEGLITHSLVEEANYDYRNENIVFRDGEMHPMLTMFYQYVEQSVICLDIQKVSARLSDIKSSQQPTTFEYTRSSLVKCKNPLEINCRELSLGTQFAYFRTISHVSGKLPGTDAPVSTDNTSNMIHKSYVNGNLIILERQIIYSFDIVYITDNTRIDEFVESIGNWVKLDEYGYHPIGDKITINCTTSELIEMLNLRWYSTIDTLTQNTSTFGYKRDDPLIIDKITSNMILKGIYPVTKETIYIHIYVPDYLWKPDDPDDPNEVHYRYMLHYGSCNPSETSVPCQITDQMYVRYYNPLEARLIGVKKGDGLLNVAYENRGQIRRPVNTEESNNFSEFTSDLATEVKFNDADPSFSDTLAGLNFDSNTGIVLNPPIQFGLIQRKAHTYGASIGNYHSREYTLINSGTPTAALEYSDPSGKLELVDTGHIVSYKIKTTDILLSNIDSRTINIVEHRECTLKSNNGYYITFAHNIDGTPKNENLFITIELGDNPQSGQNRFLELMRSL